MSNTAVKWFRQVSPQTTLTDEQITLKVFDLARGGDNRFQIFDKDQSFLEQAQALDKERRIASAPGIFGEATQAIKSGIDSTQARFFDTIGMLGQATGLDAVRDFGLRKAEENLQEAAVNAPTLPDFSEVENIGEGIRFLVGLAGSQAPQLAAVLAGTAAGAATLPAAGLSLGASAALGGGATAFTQTQNFGDLVRQGVPEDEAVGIGFGTGVISAALESIVPAVAVTPLFKVAGKATGQNLAKGILGKLPERQAVSVLRNAAKNAGVDGVAESATEMAQEAVTIASEIYAQRNNPDFEISDDDIQRRILNAGVAGGILGTGLGGVTGAITTPAPGRSNVDADTEQGQPAPNETPTATEPQDTVTGQAEVAAQRPIESLPEDPVAAPEIPLLFSPEQQQNQSIIQATQQSGQSNPANAGVMPDQTSAEGAGIPPLVTPEQQQNRAILQATQQANQQIAPQSTPQAGPLATQANVAPLEQQIEESIEELETAIQSQDADAFIAVEPKFRQVFRLAEQAGMAGLIQQQLTATLQRNRQNLDIITSILRERSENQTQTSDQQAPEVQAAPEEEVLDPEIVQDLPATVDQGGQVGQIQEPEPSEVLNWLDDESSPIVEDTQETNKIIARHPFVMEIDETTSEDVITDGSRTGKGSKNITRKYVFFEDNVDDDARVVGLPVYTVNGRAFVARPDFMPRLTQKGERHKVQSGVPYSQVIEDGRLSPIYAVRLKADNAVKGNDQDAALYFADTVDLENRLIDKAKERLADLQASAGTTQSSSFKLDEGTGNSAGGNQVGIETIGNTIEGDSFDFETAEGGDFNLFANTLLEIAGTSLPTEQQLKEAWESALQNAQQYPVVRKFVAGFLEATGLARDKKFWQKETNEQLREIAQRSFSSVVAIGSQSVRQIAGRSEGGSTQERLSDTGGQQYFSIREGQGYAGTRSEEVRGKFFSVLESLQGAGVAVSLDTAIAQEFGQTTPATNSITLALNDTQHPTLDNFRLLLHEAAHVVAASLPKPVYDAVQRAVTRYSQEKLNLLNDSADTRIRESNPDNLDPQTLAEEIFAETLAQEFGDQSISQTLASRVFRVLKDVYFRVAMVGQRLLGRQPNPDLADAYARNRFEQLVGGDADSLISFLVPNFDPRQDIEYVDRFSIRNQQTEVTKAHMDIAGHNEESKVQNLIATELEDNDAVRQEAKRLNITPKQAALSMLGLNDGAERAQEIASGIDPTTGQPLEADPTFTMDAFKGQHVRHKALRDYRVRIQKSVNRITNKLASAVNRKTEAQAQLEKLSKDLNDKHEDWLDRSKFSKHFATTMRGMMKRVLSDVEGTSFQLGEVVEELRTIRRDLSKKNLVTYYGTALRKLAQSKKLPPNFNILKFFEKVIADPEVNLLDDIDTIKASMKASNDTAYDALTEDTPESEALLASMIAYARKDDVVMLNLELAKMDSVADRHAIHNRLGEMLSGAEGEFKESLLKLKENVRLEAAARIAYKRAVRKRDQYRSAIRKSEKLIAVAEPSLKHYIAEENRLSGELGVHAQFVRYDGATYIVPPAANASPEDVRKNTKTLVLSGSNITKQSELNDHVGMMVAWLENRKAEGNLDQTYHDIAKQVKELGEGVVIKEMNKPSFLQWVWQTRWISIPDIVKGFGSNSANSIGQMVKGFVAEHGAIHKKTYKIQKQIDRNYADVMKVFKRMKTRVDLDAFISQFYNPAVEFLSKQDDINDMDVSDDQAWSIAMGRLKDFMDQVIGRKIDSPHRNDFYTTFSRLLRSMRDLNDMWVAELDASGQGGVIDDEIKILNASGMKVPAVRSRIRRGVMTVPRRISDDALSLFRVMSDDSTTIPWQLFTNASAEAMNAYEEGGAEAAWSVIGGAFDNEVIQRMFVDPIFSSESEANILPSPGPGYNAPLINVVQDAYEKSGGNLIAALEQIALEHDADPVVYIKESLDAMRSLYYELRTALKESRPDDIKSYIKEGEVDEGSIQGGGYWSQLVPGVMLHARKIDHWPSAWFRNTYMDDKTIAGINARVAAQKTFGVNNHRLAKAFASLERETNTKTDILTTMETEANALGFLNKEERDAYMAERVGGKDKLKELQRLKAMADRHLRGNDSIALGLWKFFHGKESPTEDLVLYRSLLSGLLGAIVNQPASAILQTSELFAPVLNFGVSPTSVRAIGRASAQVWRNMAGGLLNTLGINWQRNESEIQRYYDLGLNDPVLHDKLKDVVLTPNRQIHTFADRVALVTQRLTQLREASIKTKDSGNTPLRPLAPFSYYAQVLNEALVVNNWKITKEFIGSGLEILQDGNSQADWTLKKWASELNLNTFDKDSFVKFMSVLEDEYGVSFYQLIREAKGRIDRNQDILSDRTSYLLAGMALTNITQEGSIANMPVGAYNNSVMKFITPLLGWPYRQSLKVASKIMKNDGDRFTMQGLSRALLAMSVVAGGGLAISMAVDAYSEELLRKRRNLAPLSSEGAFARAHAVMEHLTRVGTFGLAGDFALEFINIGTGEGDLRGLSPERRVVALNSVFGMIGAMQSFLNQDFTADYNGVVRPVMFAMGGNGALQAIQMVNTLGGFDNQEARAIRRTNVNNWLRAAGRMSGTELRKSSGGFGTKTPVTPHISRMYMASLANDPADFRRAYQDAVKAARKAGKSEPESYVKRTFGSRSPLQIFRTRPDDTELMRILSVLPKDGKKDVLSALRMYEHYKSQLTGSSSSARTSKPVDIFGGTLF